MKTRKASHSSFCEKKSTGKYDITHCIRCSKDSYNAITALRPAAIKAGFGDQPQHTPTPVKFKVRLIKQSGNFSIDGDYSGGEELAIIPLAAFANDAVDAEAFGERIVRAVNAHEELLSTIRNLIGSLESVRANVDSPKKALNGSWYAFDHMLSDDITKAKIAIAKAEGRI